MAGTHCNLCYAVAQFLCLHERKNPMGLWDTILSFFSSDRLNINRRFDVMAEIHAGETGKVYKVREKKTGEILALKVIWPKWQKSYQMRFDKLAAPSEPDIALGLEHSNLVETFEVGFTNAEEPYLLMEYCEGFNLDTLLKQRGDLDGKRIPLLRQMAEGLRAVHQKGYIHRDVCPENFVISLALDRAKLLDFSLTVPNQSAYLVADPRSGRDAYMAPELMRPHETDQKIDIYAFGVTAFQLLTRRLPWDEDAGGTSIARAVRNATDIKKLRPKIQPQLARAIHSCLLPRKAERCATMDEFLEQLQGLKHEDITS